jgi:hypothetical protein
LLQIAISHYDVNMNISLGLVKISKGFSFFANDQVMSVVLLFTCLIAIYYSTTETSEKYFFYWIATTPAVLGFLSFKKVAIFDGRRLIRPVPAEYHSKAEVGINYLHHFFVFYGWFSQVGHCSFDGPSLVDAQPNRVFEGVNLGSPEVNEHCIYFSLFELHLESSFGASEMRRLLERSEGKRMGVMLLKPLGNFFLPGFKSDPKICLGIDG